MAVKHYADLNLTGHVLSDFLLTSSTALKAAGKLRYSGGKYYGYTTEETAFLTKLDEDSLSVLSASELTTARKLWGNSFNGSADVNGDITLGSGKKIYFGDTGRFIGVDADGNLYTDSGFYSTSFISARGKDDSGSSGGGADLEAVWNSLTGTVAPYATSVINVAHIPTLAQSKITGLESALSAINESISAINALIPTEASSTNQLADKAFVNSSISTATATFRGTVTSLADLKALTGDLNDYAFYSHDDAAGNTVYSRYKYDPTYTSTETGHWKFEYDLNNSSFTAAQWSAINSGITDTLVNKLNGIEAGAQANVLEIVMANGVDLEPDSNRAVDITFGTGASNGTVKFCGTDYSVKGLAALAYKSSLAFSELTGRPTTLSGYGITDGVNALAWGGEGNAVTAASVSGHTLTLTKGATFATTSDISGAVFVDTKTVTTGTSYSNSVTGTIVGVTTRYKDAECICEVTYSNANKRYTVTWGFTADSTYPMTINVFYKK